MHISHLTIRVGLVIALVLAAIAALAQAPVANLSIVRQVEVTRAPVAQGRDWAPAKQNQGIITGYGIRTLKRSQAEIKFKDNSVLRMNERTEISIQDAAQMRKIHLAEGAVWVHVAKGANTSVETPSCTATARGTTFVVILEPNGRTRVVVFEGNVDVHAGANTVTVHPAQSTETGDNGQTGSVNNVSQGDLPVELGGTVVGWWENVPSGYSLQVTTGTNVADNLRNSTVSDAIPGSDENVTVPFFIPDTEQRNAFLAVADQDVVPSVEMEMRQNNLTLDAFQQQEGSTPLSQWELPAATMQLMQSLGITTVGEAVQAILANGGTITIDVRGRQVQFQPGAVHTSQANLRTIDRTESSTSTLVTGLALSLLADRGNWRLSSPQTGGLLYGFSGTPGFIGGRGEVRGTVGNTRYILEGNALKFVNGPASQWFTRVGSVSVVERDLRPDLTAFAGRRRFYYGPVFQNQVATQLVADRYSGAGLRWTPGRWSFEGAWLYDSNPQVLDAQRGMVGAASVKAGGGVFGLQVLEATGVTKGHGHTLSYSYPLLPNRLETYGEIGTGVDDATLQTYGFYFPGIYQRTNIDLFLEYGNHEGIGEAISLVACKQVATDGELRAYLNRQDGKTTGGFAAIWRFGSYTPQDAGNTR